MLWAKNVIAWTKSYEIAFETLVHLNNKYCLDGRNPNSYAGILWCFGKHDRPWMERPVFGKMRYMTSGGTGKKFDANEPAILKDADSVSDDDMIFDIGPKSAQELADIIMKAGTVVWNGPVGVFEFDQFGEGTRTVAMAIAETNAFTLAGGGDTIAAIQKYDIYDKVSYISTAGGAFLEFLEGKKLPAVEILEQRAAEKRT